MEINNLSFIITAVGLELFLHSLIVKMHSVHIVYVVTSLDFVNKLNDPEQILL